MQLAIKKEARARLIFVLMIALAFAAAACNALLDFESYKVGADGGNPSDGGNDGDPSIDGGDASDGGCIDPTGFGGRGCYRCTPTTNEQLLSACTTSKFETFDNAARIKNFDPNMPKPPLENGGPLPPNFDAGTSSSGTTTSDAGCPFDNPSLPNPVLILGATGFPMETIAKALGDTATLYYFETGSCLGVGAAALNYPLLKNQVIYFDRNQEGKAVSCRLPDGTSMAADVAFSGAFPDTCSGADLDSPAKGINVLGPNTQLPPDWKDYIGAINPIMFATPPTSTERVISAEAAWRVYGFGSGSSPFAKSVAPWVDEAFIFRRTETSGTQQAFARILGMPSNALRGTNSTGSTAMRKAFQLSANPQATIGISSSEIVDIDRTSMKSLAYQHYNQPVGFYPDSDPGLFDRRNIRDGHYSPWIALHIFSRVDPNGDPISSRNAELECSHPIGDPQRTCASFVSTNGKTRAERDAAVKRLVYVMANRQEPPVKTVDLFGALKKLGNAPVCAMTVTRPTDGADLAPFKPPTSCACAFEAASPGSIPADCKQCTLPSDCTGAKATCTFGFCE
jgi:hypothetical protein